MIRPLTLTSLVLLCACKVDTSNDTDTGTDTEAALIDADGDGWFADWGDCDDTNADINAGAVEVDNNSVDDDCDGRVDEGNTGGGPYHESVRPHLIAGADFLYASAFEYPVGNGDSRTHCNDGDDWYVAQEFKERDACGLISSDGPLHLGEDWNGEGGGNTDLGEAVGAIGNGEVVYARFASTGWGDVVIVRHVAPPGGAFERPDGGTVGEVFSLYAHLDEILVQDGDAIAIGDLVGTVGTARGRYAAHLHLEIGADPQASFPGPGYSSSSFGRVDPTDFLDLNRTVEGGTETLEVCNGLDDDANGLIDDIGSCWQAIYRYQHTSGARCWGTSDAGPPPGCAGYTFDREAWIAPSTPIPNTYELRQCSYETDHILVPHGSGDQGILEGDGYDCSVSLGRAYTEGAAPTATSVQWPHTCPVYRFAWSIDGSGTHLFTPGPDGVSGMTCEGHPFDVHTTSTCFTAPPAECAQ